LFKFGSETRFLTPNVSLNPDYHWLLVVGLLVFGFWLYNTYGVGRGTAHHNIYRYNQKQYQYSSLSI